MAPTASPQTPGPREDLLASCFPLAQSRRWNSIPSTQPLLFYGALPPAPAPGPRGRTFFFLSSSPQFQGLISFTTCLRCLSSTGTESGCCEIRLLHQDTFFLSPSADCHSAHMTEMTFTSLSKEKVTITVIASTC